MRSSRWFALLLLLGLGAAAPARAQEDFNSVDVAVNVLKGATATDDTIKAVLAAANEILKQAKVELQLKKTNRNVSDGGNDDGEVTEDERKQPVAAGAKELDTVCGKGKGYKLTIALDADVADQSNVGRTGHGFGVTIAELLTNNGESGYNVAHEFCRAFTLGANHKVNGTTNADGTGHVNDITNLMDPAIGDGTTLTADQIAEIRKRATRRGTVKQKAGNDGAAQKKGQKAGEDVDKKSGEGGEPAGILPKSDFRRSGLFLDGGDALASGHIQMQGRFDSLVPTQCLCTMFIDADANPGAGQHEIVDGLPIGAEYLVQITASGNGVDPIQLSGFLGNTLTLQQFPLASLELETVLDIADKAPGGCLPCATPTLDQIDFEVHAAQLGPVLTPLQVGVRFTDQIALTVDEMQFQFREWPRGCRCSRSTTTASRRSRSSRRRETASRHRATS
jgi:hypothetical protein